MVKHKAVCNSLRSVERGQRRDQRAIIYVFVKITYPLPYKVTYKVVTPPPNRTGPAATPATHTITVAAP